MEGSLMMYLPGAPLEVERTLEVLDSLTVAGAVEKIIGGHRTMTPEELAVRRDYIRGLLTGVKASLAEGLTMDEAIAKLSLESGFESVKGLNLDETAPRYHAGNVMAVWMSLTESAANALARKIDEEGLEVALSAFETIRSDTASYYTDEREFNALGYRFINERRADEAIAVFKINTELYPNSWNVWDSLGEGYARADRVPEALAAYRKSVELNPQSRSGHIWIGVLEGRTIDVENEVGAELEFEPGAQTGLQGPYLGQEPPGLEPKLFASGIISAAGHYDYRITFTPDGREIYFTQREGRDGLSIIKVARLGEDGWLAPEPASFSGKYVDFEPQLSPDGSKLFYNSRRPMPGSDEPNQSGDVWMLQRTGDGWGDARHIGPGMCPSPASSGNLYITRFSDAGAELVMARPEGEAFGEFELLPGDIKTGFNDAHPCVAPDESFILFDSFHPDGRGGADTYVSFRRGDGTWGPAVNLGENINTPGENICATLSPDGKYIFYTAYGDIYWVSAEILDKLRK